jgi:hypothetical protein
MESAPVTPPTTIISTAATSVLQIRAEAIARRLQLILPDIYQDVFDARTNLKSAIKTCSGGGEWARVIVQDSAVIRRLTNSAADLTNGAQKKLHVLLQETEEHSDSQVNDSIEKILLMIDEARRSLQQSTELSDAIASSDENDDFGSNILKAQKQVLLLMRSVTKSLDHATSICWVETTRNFGKQPHTSAPSTKTPSNEAMEANAQEQRSLPFVPPPVLKHASAKMKQKVPLPVDCVLFCSPEARSRTKLKKSGCMHGCRVASAVLPKKKWPGKWDTHVDCLEYCQKTVDQVMYEREKEEEEEESGTGGRQVRDAADVAMQEEDHRAMWVAECSYSCKKNIVLVVK